MTVRNLKYLFQPSSIALIGAGKTRGSVGQVLARNLFNAGFDGPVMPVNPRHRAIEGVLTYPDVASLPMTPDLAVISTPPETVPGIVRDLAMRGTRAAVVISAGFSEVGEQGADLQREMLSAARSALLRIVGPNCLGIMVPGIGLNASFCHLNPGPGRLAFVAQSGAIVTSVADWADRRGIGFSHLVSLGGMADVDFGDMLDYLANDPETRAIMLYIESVRDARKFLSAGRAAARMKPVVVVKAGRHPEGARAAASHTGAMAGSDEVYDTVFRRAGMLRVTGLLEVFDAVEILAMPKMPQGDRLAILTNGGGIGVLATDALMDNGGHLAELSTETIGRLNEVLPPTWSRGNPVDIIGDADGRRYAAAVEAVIEDENVDALLVLNCPTAIASGLEAARAVTDALGPRPPVPVITSWVGDAAAQAAREHLAAHHLPSYYTPGQAVSAFMYLVRYQRSQELLMETPPSVPEEFRPDTERAREIIAGALKESREWLNEVESKELLAAYEMPVVPTRIAATPEEAAAVAAELGSAVALKVLSRDITHKSDVGGVALDISGPAEVRERARAMLERIRRELPEARITGFTVSPMVRRPGAYELIAGMFSDRQFGPVLLFGAGGTAVEVMDDKAIGLPPLNMRLAREIIAGTRIYRLLRGFRGQRAVNLEAVALTLIKLSQLVIDLDEVVELDINPLLADEYGVIGLDARVRVQPFQGKRGCRLSIRPYPKDLESEVELANGRHLLLRPILPEDEPALQSSIAALTPEQRRLRFFVPLKTLDHVMAARFTQIDYDREMALILTERGIPGETPVYGVVNIVADPDHERAEYAIMVRSDMTGQGLGRMLMERIIDYARSRGIREIYGDVLRENGIMLRLCDKLGFVQSCNPEEPDIIRVALALDGAGGEATPCGPGRVEPGSPARD